MLNTGYILAQVATCNLPKHIQAPKATTNQPQAAPIIPNYLQTDPVISKTSSYNLKTSKIDICEKSLISLM